MPCDYRRTYQSPDEQLREITTILARGVLRLRKIRGAHRMGEAENSPDSDADRLELSDTSRLNVTEGLTP